MASAPTFPVWVPRLYYWVKSKYGASARPSAQQLRLFRISALAAALAAETKPS